MSNAATRREPVRPPDVETPSARNATVSISPRVEIENYRDAFTEIGKMSHGTAIDVLEPVPRRDDRETVDVAVSIIVPLYNEEQSVPHLYRSIIAVMEPLCRSFEILFVDDGSNDGTFARALEIAESDKRLRIIKFRRNFGQTPAMAAGIEFSRGEILITMDGDLQNDPEDIPRFLDKLEEGFDLVVGWRHRRHDKFLTRKLPSKVANWLIAKVTGIPIRDNGCSLKAYRARLIKNIPIYSDMHRFIPAMMSLSGTRLTEIKVRHHARKFGHSKYGLSRIYKVFFDLIAIRTILVCAQRPALWFASSASILACVALLTFVVATNLSIGDPSRSSVVMFGVSLTFGAASVFLVVLGILVQLLFKTGDVTATTFANLTVSGSDGVLAHNRDMR